LNQNSPDKRSFCTEREYAALLAENRALQAENKDLLQYVRAKTDGLLKVMGTVVLKPEELNDASLIEFDPIGIVTESFVQILANLRKTNLKLHTTHLEIQAIFDSVGAAIMVLDPQRRIITCNENARHKLLFGTTDFIGKSCRDTVCRDKTPAHQCVHKMVMTSGHTENCPGWNFGRHSFDVIGQPIKNDSDEVTHVVLVYNEITEHLRNAEALQCALIEAKEAKAQIDGLLKSMSDGLIASDSDGAVVLMNPAAEQLLNTTFEASFGRSISDATTIPTLKEYFDKLIRSEANHSDEFELQRSDGTMQTCQARSSVLLESGRVNGYITFLQDVSREREIERMKDEFLSTAAHQLRTPLASVIGYAELIMYSEALDKETLGDYISMIYSKAEQLSEIVSNLLDISRIEAGHHPIIVQSAVPVDALIDEVLVGFRKSCLKHVFKVNLQQRGLLLNIDRFAILQVLENLLSNAVKYSPEGGVIKIEGMRLTNHYQLSVADQGLGMTDQQATQAFEKFYRADSSNTAISGSGLGLTIVRYLVEAHGGKVWIETEPGSGTIVHTTLPLSL